MSPLPTSPGWKPSVRRPRVSRSCRMCNTRKIRCDRKVPFCTQCIKTGHTDRCIYKGSKTARTVEIDQLAAQTVAEDPDNMADIITMPGPSAQQPTIVETVEVGNHQSSLTTNEQHIPDSFDSFDTFFGMASDAFDLNFDLSPGSRSEYVKPSGGFSVSFYGATSSTSCVASFPGLIETVRSITSEYVPSVSQDCQSLELSKPLIKHHHSHSSNPEAALSLLPPRFRCDQLMQAYFKHCDITQRILHQPTFWRQYNDFWDSPSKKAENSLLYIIFAAISCVRCLEVDTPLAFDGDGSVADREAVYWATIAKEWSDRQGLKHMTLDFFQLKCLLVLSQRINLIKFRNQYPSSQTLLAIAMTAALHRSDACLSLSTSHYEREMRRRIWWTITEMDLVECIERGLPSLVQNLHSDIEPPLNVLDSELDESAVVAPIQRDDAIFTESTFARQAAVIQPLRYKVSTIVNDPVKHKSLAAAEINTLHEEIVGWLSRVVGDGEVSAQSDVLLGKTVLELNLHELLLLLHYPFATTSSDQFNNHHSRFVCQGSARNTIELFLVLTDAGLSQSSLPRSYIQRAILVICRIDTLSISRNPIYPQVIDANAAVDLALKTFDMYEERILARGNGFRGFWLIFAATCSLRRHQDSHAARTWRDKISARIIALCSKISMLQPVDSRNEQRQNAVFARYMRHLQRTGVLAGFDTAAANTEDLTINGDLI